MITLITWVQCYRLKPPQPLFSKCEKTASLCMGFCQINTTKVIQNCPIKMGQLWTKRDLWLEKLISNFSCQNSNNLWHAQIKQIFVYPWTCWEKLIFDQSFVSKHQIFSLGHLKNLEVGKHKLSVIDLKHKHLATCLL